MSVQNKIERTLIRAATVGGAAALGSMLFTPGGSVALMGTQMPKMVVAGLAGMASSVAADYLVPMTRKLVPNVAGLGPLEEIVIGPLVVGVAMVAVEAVLAPGAVEGSHNLIAALASGSAAAVAAGYLSQGMGWSASVVAY